MTDTVEIVLDDRDPWDQLPDEPKLWFERFTQYRLIGPYRTVPKAYRIWRKTENRETGRTYSAAHWYDKARQWRWEERANAWDDMRREEEEDKAIAIYSEGLAFSHNRIAKLKAVADKLENFIMDARTTRVSPFVIEQYRGLLDDIAKERGERQRTTQITGPAGGAIVIETQWGRGGSASNAWEQKQIAPPAPETVIEAVVKEENTNDERS